MEQQVKNIQEENLGAEEKIYDIQDDRQSLLTIEDVEDPSDEDLSEKMG